MYRSGKIPDALQGVCRAAQLRPYDVEAVSYQTLWHQSSRTQSIFSNLDHALNVLISNLDDPKTHPRIWIAEQYSHITSDSIDTRWRNF